MTIQFDELSSDQLRDLIAQATAALSARAAAPRRIVRAMPSYNSKRYGAPWIARVTSWPIGGRAELAFGSFLGDSRNGGAGELEIMASPGDVVRWGQKDYRNPRYTEANWGVVGDDGVIGEVSEAAARQAFSG